MVVVGVTLVRRDPYMGNCAQYSVRGCVVSQCHQTCDHGVVILGQWLSGKPAVFRYPREQTSHDAHVVVVSEVCPQRLTLSTP